MELRVHYYVHNIPALGPILGHLKQKQALTLSFNWAPHHEGLIGSGGIALLILWPRHWMEVSGQIHVSAPLPPGKEPLVPIG
jgi:hypothetical protein